MRKTLSAASALLAVSALFAQSGQVAAAAGAATDPAVRAVHYLAAQLQPDGSLDESAGETEDFVIGASAAGIDPATLTSGGGRSALDYLAGYSDAGFGGLAAGPTAKLILALQAARRDPGAFGAARNNLVAHLQALAKPGGAFGDGQAFTQSLSILALRSAGQPVPAVGITYLKAAQNSDGSWNFKAIKDDTADGDTNSTALVLEALAAVGDHAGDGAALTWLRTQQLGDAGFPYQNNTAFGLPASDPDSDSLVIEALFAAGQDPGSAAWARAGATPRTNLLTFQAASGGFAFPGNPGPDSFTTSQVPQGLVGAPLPVAGIFAAGVPGQFHVLPTPARVLDTRLVGGPLGSGETREVLIGGLAGVPAAATAVVINVTVTDTTAAGYLTVWPAGAPQPATSNLNWVAGAVVSNAVSVALGASGQVALYSRAGTTDVVIDLAGYFAPPVGQAGLYNALRPIRILDTRMPAPGGAPGSPVGPGGQLQFDVAGRGGIPATGVSAVVINLTVSGGTAASYLAVYPGGAARPASSNLNWSPGQTLANRVTVAVGASGQVAAYNLAGSVDVVVDVSGWYTDQTPGGTGSLFVAAQPVRILDTRGLGKPLGASSTRATAVAGEGGAPTPGGANPPRAAVMNVTVTGSADSGYLTVYPDAVPPPNAVSDVNWSPAQTVPNLVVARLAPDGSVSLRNSAAAVDVIVDLVGWYV